MSFPAFAFKVWMPYVVKKLEDETGGWVLLNREYRILGTPLMTSAPTAHVSVHKYARIRRISQRTQVAISKGGTQATKLILDSAVWLYDDMHRPDDSAQDWDDYARRLKLLSTLRCFGE